MFGFVYEGIVCFFQLFTCEICITIQIGDKDIGSGSEMPPFHSYELILVWKTTQKFSKSKPKVSNPEIFWVQPRYL